MNKDYNKSDFKLSDKLEETLSTQIPVLDKLLGIESDKSSNFSLEPNQIFVIRGEPGSGKTTLGLQILSKNIEKLVSIQSDLNEKIPKLVFISLERDPNEILRYAKTHYALFSDEIIGKESRYLSTLGFENMQTLLQIIQKNKSSIFKAISAKIKEISKTGKFKEVAVKSSVEMLMFITDKLYKRKHKEQVIKSYQNEKISFVFIDSLNVLVQLFQQLSIEKDIPERLLLSTICEALRHSYPDSIIILTSEYHYQDAYHVRSTSESFFCDIEIALFSEPIVAPPNYEFKFESPLGSNVLSLLTDKVSGIQTQSFCRVLKSRKSPNQSRRCAYDIVTGKGIEFYETYPGDGHLVLFAENSCQQDIWSEFFNRDLPVLYPALRHNSFDRSSLQRTSAAQRRFRYVPSRVDMYLSSFDNYWLNWYSELCLKSNVASLLEKYLNLKDIINYKELFVILNVICDSITKGKAFTAFQQYLFSAITKDFNIGNYFQTILKNLITKSTPNTESWIVEAAQNLTKKDNFEKFMSGLYTTLIRDESNIDSSDSKDMNSPCMQCLWSRQLLKELYSKLDLYKNEIGKYIKFEKKSMSSSETHEDKGIFESSEPVDVSTTFNNNLKRIVSLCTRDILNRSTLKCSYKHELDNPDHLNMNKLFMQNNDICIWNLSILRYLCKFLIVHFIDHDPKQEKKDISWKNFNDYELIGKNVSDVYISLINIMESSLNVRVKEVLLEMTPDITKLLNTIQQKLISSVFNVFPEELSNNINYETLKKFVPSNGAINYKDHWLVILANIFYDTIHGEVNYRLVTPIHISKLRLFGERKSAIIPELENHRLDSNRPIHRPEYFFSLKDQNRYCSIPYDANIGFIVFRKEILIPFYDQLRQNKNNFKDEYIELIVKLITNQRSAIEAISKQLETNYEDPLRKSPGIIKKEVTQLIHHRLADDKPPETWEEIIAYYLIEQKKKKNQEFHFLIETLTPDSLLSTLLEFIWSCGANLRISPDYTIESKEDNLVEIFRAFYILALMFQNNIIPTNATLDAADFAHKYNPSKEKKNYDWVFARHWYSTLIELLSTPSSDRKNLTVDNSEFMWHQKEIKLDIMPIPVSFANYMKYKENVWHISCWGDWHLAMMNGSENIELGCDLINNIMSSDRVCERAFSNSAVPTVEAFYERYGDSLCFNQPKRKDIELPNWTYNQLRKTLFARAKSRSQIFDFHHCMRELHSVLEFVHFAEREQNKINKVRLSDEFRDKLFEKLLAAFENIENFKNESFLLA
ncbi:hypothetical protein JXB12_11135 [candidate division KSB1 bacterium]|nr:hypothetical protein [candidate division KSB1 bacterium]